MIDKLIVASLLTVLGQPTTFAACMDKIVIDAEGHEARLPLMVKKMKLIALSIKDLDEQIVIM